MRERNEALDCYVRPRSRIGGGPDRLRNATGANWSGNSGMERPPDEPPRFNLTQTRPPMETEPAVAFLFLQPHPGGA